MPLVPEGLAKGKGLLVVRGTLACALVVHVLEGEEGMCTRICTSV